MLQDITTPVVRNRDLGGRNFLLEFEAPEMAKATAPGQFFMIGIPGSEVLLRRPFSVCGLPGTFDDGGPRSIQILYRVYGRGTELLASLKSGAPISVLGPLGKGFIAPPERGARAVFVAGGIGSAPFPALATHLLREGIRVRLLYGARTASELPLLDWFREHCQQVVVTTDDGSLGRKGVVTSALREVLEEDTGETVHVYGCGPTPMLRAVAAMVVPRKTPCHLSVEAPMACGFGVCLGCVVPTRSGPGEAIRYERVCVEGPVMEAGRLAW